MKNSEVLGKKIIILISACPVGKNINIHLGQLFKETDALVCQFLGDKSLQEFTEYFD
ncbi:hypothetical protein [Chryseobacterium indoltheticum]|uniref:hypothetical protein n=1 Tax=Chryseobacterium indoltheticum TaxID=254 RepID=UPI003F499EFB